MTVAAILPSYRSRTLNLTDLCLILGMLFAFATLVVKIIEVSRNR